MTGKDESWRTAEEVMNELLADPEYAQRLEEVEQRVAAKESQFAEASKPLTEQLRSVGLELTSVWDLVNTDEPYPQALAILVKHQLSTSHSTIPIGSAKGSAAPSLSRTRRSHGQPSRMRTWRRWAKTRKMGWRSHFR